MRIKKWLPYLICLIFITMLVTIIPKKVLAAGENILDIKANFGIDGKYKQSASIPIELEIKNSLKEEVKGELKILVPNDKENDSYSMNFLIGAEETKKLFIPVNNGGVGKKVKVKVISDGKTLVEKEIAMSLNQIDFDTAFFGALTDDMKSLEYFNNLVVEGNEEMPSIRGRVASISNELLLSNYKNLQMLNFIILNNFDSSKLTKEALDNLNLWINNGGVLLIGGGDATLNKMDKSFLNVSYTNQKDKWIAFKEDGVTLKTGILTGDIGSITLGDSNNIVATTQKRGNGSIIITSFDLGSKNFYEFAEVNNLLSSIMKEDIIRKFGSYDYMSSYPYALENSLSNVPVDGEMPISKIVIILVTFILLVSFISYFILKKINKRELIWMIIPVLSVIFTLIVYKVGDATSLSDKILNSVNIINVDKEGNGKIDSYIAIGNKYNSPLYIEEPKGTRIEYMVNDQMRMMGFMPTNPSDKIALDTIYEGNKTFYNFNDVAALELKKFKILGQEKKVNKVSSTLNYLDNGLNGKINNPYNTDVKKMIVVFGNNVWDIGTLKAGEGYTFNNELPKSIGGIRGYQQSIFEDYYTQQGSNKNNEEFKEKYKNIMRDLTLLEFVGNSKGSGAYIVAITDETMEYGLNFEKEDISKFSNTCYISEIEIGLKDSEGNTVYPLGYISPNIESRQDRFSVDTSRNVAWGDGEAIISYQLPDKFVPSLIKLKALPGENLDKEGNVIEFKGSIQLFNNKTGKFEDIAYSNSTGIELTDLKNYLSNGLLKFKIIGKNEEGCSIPTIGVKGRFKE